MNQRSTLMLTTMALLASSTLVAPSFAVAAPAVIRGRVTVAAAIRDACVPLLERHRKLSDPKRFAKRHAVLRSFLFNPSLLTIRRAHGEAARRHHHHLGALSAFLEAVLRLQHPFLGRGQRRRRVLVSGDDHFESGDVSGVIDRVWQDVSILVAGVVNDERCPDQGAALHCAQDSRQHECNRRSKTHGRILQTHHRKLYTKRQYVLDLGAKGVINRKDFACWGQMPKVNAPEYDAWVKEARKFGKAIWDITGKRDADIVFEHPGEQTFPV